MVTFKSALGNQSISDESFANDDMRRFVVDDSSAQDNYRADNYRSVGGIDEVMQTRQERLAQAKQVNPNVKRRIESLLGIGQASTNVVVNETDSDKLIFTVRTLKSSETRALLKIAKKLAMDKDADGTLTLRVNLLAFATTEINGVSLEDILDIYNLDERQKHLAKFEFIDNFDDTIINYVHAEWEQLSKRHTKRYAIKNTEDAKEVAGQMKKSSERA